MNAEQILNFTQDYFAWTYLPYQSINATCDKEAFMDWQCCPFHQQGLQELERFKQIARAIEDQFPDFYQTDPHSSVLSQAWFLRLSEVAGVPLPARKMVGWLHTEVIAPTNVYMFTLVFRPGSIAVLQVRGAESLDEARAFACGVLPHVSYEVRDGDETNGHVKPFSAWTCAQAQEGKASAPKSLTNLTDAELEQMCNEIEEIIDGLSRMGELPDQEERQLQLREALNLGETLELEEMRRLIEKVHAATRQVTAGGGQ